MKKIILLSLLCLGILNPTSYAITPYQPLNKDIFQWVFSTARAGYYFNTKAMGYEVTPNGDVDTNILIVPTVRLFDDMQVKDIKMKRQWHDKSIYNFNNLVGTAEYLRINLNTKDVEYNDIRYLDRGYNPFAESFTEPKINLDKLSNKDIRKDFLNAIIEYANSHKEELLERAKKDANSENIQKLDELIANLPQNTIEEVTHTQHQVKDTKDSKRKYKKK